MTPADAPRRANKDGRLSASSIADILKDFFKRVGDRADLVTGQADFAAASTHWLRHTFAHRVIAETDAKLATVQKLLGHASLVTTGLYLDADMTERVRAVAQLQEVF
jgi:site-specific recombinase XerD